MSKERLLLFGEIREEVNRGLVLGVCVVPMAAFDLAPGACLGVYAVDVRAICAPLSKCAHHLARGQTHVHQGERLKRASDDLS